MLFGVKLANDIYPAWKDSYIDYERLKKLLKENDIIKDPPSCNNNKNDSDLWNDKDEANFVEALDHELEKVYTFQMNKYDTLMEKLNHLEKQTSNEDALKTLDFQAFQHVLEDILSESQELDSFNRLNYTGFMKIIKKHDKLHSGYPSVRSLLEVRLKELPFHSEEYSPLLYRISFLYNILRSNFGTVSQSLASTSKLSSATGDHEMSFKRFKFWIHPDNLMEVKTRILRHLPVLVYASALTENNDILNRFDTDLIDTDGNNNIPSSNSSVTNSDTENELARKSYDPIITNLYFDNEFFELYNNKLLKTSTAPTLRLRWTGKLIDKPDIFLEKRMSIENPKTGNIDLDETRLKLKQKFINGFIFNGDKHYKANVLRKLKDSGIDETDLNKMSSDFDAIQTFIMQEELQPVLRTTYTRTAFQIPGDDRLRMTIDSDILYIREDSFDKSRPIRDPHNWHRTDLDSAAPIQTKHLRTGEYSKFPFSVMEIKIKNAAPSKDSDKGSSMSTAKLPIKHGQWIYDLTNSHLVKEVPKFSSYVQGVASLFGEDDKLDILPFWLPELENDIRIDPKQAYEEEQLKLRKQKETQARIDGLRRLSKVDNSSQPSEVSIQRRSASPAQAEEEDTRPEADLEDHESSDEEDNNNVQRQRRKKDKRKTKTGQTFFKILAGRDSKLTGVDSEDEEIHLPPGVKKPTSFLKNAGPLKIEAKVWLANERTFNRWLKVTTLLSILTFSIYNSVKKSSFPQLADMMAYIYFALTLFCGIWAYSTYINRLKIIKERSGKHLDAPLGPLVLAVILAFTLIVNFGVAFREEAKNQILRNQQLSVQSDPPVQLSETLTKIQNFIFYLVGATTN
ncbi:vacuolar transporter chaperone NDAI_0G03350 [Naumovozyma dairenensis CBS 421]|uniref:SPX domain-containing protein n=1 Tax=Naumovozyma dairenensis (strain ATCC 10597 / BCRC 20456 / CBS 421 / NBRC 0211 / NRRL Y-12639) TaxID=1071378 RepID=G0WEA1_NAUDC|nr:hypothetical protein NDAI_0G03350 [Naumovozyma dairenensis CBS 421]CCD26112.2 hypothetical protein NDAI_0G03350 [Naumovozyma dairenensis CBS 421]